MKKSVLSASIVCLMMLFSTNVWAQSGTLERVQTDKVVLKTNRTISQNALLSNKTMVAKSAKVTVNSASNATVVALSPTRVLKSVYGLTYIPIHEYELMPTEKRNWVDVHIAEFIVSEKSPQEVLEEVENNLEKH